jgi:hypothetical protein
MCLLSLHYKSQAFNVIYKKYLLNVQSSGQSAVILQAEATGRTPGKVFRGLR